MGPDLPDLYELQALVAVVDAGSVSAGARDLNQPRATISRRLARLEERLGVRLLHRTTRRLALTGAGEDLFGHARGILSAVEVATRGLQQQNRAPSGLLRLSVPPITDARFREMLIAFVKTWPEVQLEVISTTVHQDLLTSHIDVALRAGTDLDAGLIARRVSETAVLGVASAKYLAKHGTPKTTSALVDHRCLVGFSRGERAHTHWPLLDGGRVRVTPHIASNDLSLLSAAVRADEGIALLPELFVSAGITSGELVPVLPDVLGASSQVALVFAERHLMRPVVRAFVDHAVDWWHAGGLSGASPD